MTASSFPKKLSFERYFWLLPVNLSPHVTNCYTYMYIINVPFKKGDVTYGCPYFVTFCSIFFVIFLSVSNCPIKKKTICIYLKFVLFENSFLCLISLKWVCSRKLYRIFSSFHVWYENKYVFVNRGTSYCLRSNFNFTVSTFTEYTIQFENDWQKRSC